MDDRNRSASARPSTMLEALSLGIFKARMVILQIELEHASRELDELVGKGYEPSTLRRRADSVVRALVGKLGEEVQL